MKRWLTIPRPLLPAVLWVLGLATVAAAQVHLSYSPTDTTITPGDQGRLSILIADTLEVRTIDVTVTYDTTVVRSVAGAAGKLYTDSGIFTYQGFEEDSLGTWHGYAVLMGAGLFVLGPGELYTWDFEALAEGVTPITTVSVYVATTDGSWFEEVTLPGTTITVHDPLSAVDGPPGPPAAPMLYPNPFNPRTIVRFDLDRDGPVHLDVFDIRGRLVATLRDGWTCAGPVSAPWDGRDRDGRSVPGGVYLFRLRTDHGATSTRGVLLK